MPVEEVRPEVILDIAPHAVDVVGVVLRVVVLDDERRSLDHIVVRFSWLQAAAPREVDVLDSRPSDLLKVTLGEFPAMAMGVFPDEIHQQAKLFHPRPMGHPRHGKSVRSARFEPGPVGGDEPPDRLLKEIR